MLSNLEFTECNFQTNYYSLHFASSYLDRPLHIVSMSIFGGNFKYREKLNMIKLLHPEWFAVDKDMRIKYTKKQLNKYKGDANKVIEDILKAQGNNKSLNGIGNSQTSSAINIATVDIKEWDRFIIDSFIENQNRIWALVIPKDINQSIFMFYDKRRYFDQFDENEFKLSSNGSIIIPNNTVTANRGSNYMIYPSPNGFTRGIHEWSVKYLSHNGYSHFERSIGITSAINQTWISTGVDANRCLFDYDTYSSYFDGAYLDDWSPTKTITVSLDMNSRVVTYFCDDVQVQQDSLDSSPDIFYFALCINSHADGGTFESL